MGGFEKTFVERFSIPSLVIARNLSLKEFISNMPRFPRGFSFRWYDFGNTLFDGQEW